MYHVFPFKAREKNILVLVIGRVDFDANKKKWGPQNKYDTKKNTSPEFSSLVNHGICGHLCLGLQVHLQCTF